MKSLKKIAAVALAGVMALGVFSACGSGSAATLTDDLNKMGYKLTYSVEADNDITAVVDSFIRYKKAEQDYLEDTEELRNKDTLTDKEEQELAGAQVTLARRTADIFMLNTENERLLTVDQTRVYKLYLAVDNAYAAMEQARIAWDAAPSSEDAQNTYNYYVSAYCAAYNRLPVWNVGFIDEDYEDVLDDDTLLATKFNKLIEIAADKEYLKYDGADGFTSESVTAKQDMMQTSYTFGKLITKTSDVYKDEGITSDTMVAFIAYPNI